MDKKGVRRSDESQERAVSEKADFLLAVLVKISANG